MGGQILSENKIRNIHFSRQKPGVSAPPFDLSFMKITNVCNLESRTPRKLRVGCPKKAENDQYLTRAVWLNNNRITDIERIVSLNKTFQYIEWLDLSYNQIKDISDEIIELQNLKILYLHHNRIQYLVQVAKLGPLQQLRVLTLFGNPVEDIPSYRKHVLLTLPRLRKLDHSVVVANDKAAIM